MNTAPKRLREMMGYTPKAPKASSSVLLIIDAQQEYTEGKLPLTGIDDAINAGALLLNLARQLDVPVIHVLHRGQGDFFKPESTGFLPIPALTPEKHEYVIEKSFANAFQNTRLLETLQALGREALIIMGFMTHNCVSASVWGAKSLAYDCHVFAPGTASRDLPDGSGGIITAKTIQTGTLAGLSDTAARIVHTVTDIFEDAPHG